MDIQKLFMSNCRMTKTNLYVQSCETLRRYITLDLTPTPEDLEKIDSAITYMQKLPPPVLEDLFAYFKSPSREYYTCYIVKNIEAWHVALFTYEGQKQLCMDFANKDFDLNFFLDVCLKKLSRLEELKLPEQSHLSANLCKKLCENVPNLQNLSLLAVDIADFAIQFIANLPLSELELGGMIVTKSVLVMARGFVDPQISVLCREDSIIRNTLLDLKLGDYVNQGCYSLVLRSMPNLEYLDFSRGTWLTELPPDLVNQQFNLKRLVFCNLSEEVEKELNIALSSCPLVNSVEMTTDKFSRQILSMLTTWNNLTVLDFKVVRSSYFDENSSSVVLVDNTFEAGGFQFPNLKEFSIRDRRNLWLANKNNFNSFLAICPQLSNLTLIECIGFDDQMALQTSRQLTGKNIKRIQVQYCNFFRSPGIRHLLSIPSLSECFIELLLTQAEKQQLDIESLEEQAKNMGKNLTIKVTIRTLFHDLLSRLLQ